MWQFAVSHLPFLRQFAAGCTTEVFGFPVWYKYLPTEEVTVIGRSGPVCQIANNNIDWTQPQILLGVGVALIEILLRVAALVAVGYIIYAGFQYITSNGDPERAKHAKDTILNALIGLVIAIAATVMVGFLGRSLTT